MVLVLNATFNTISVVSWRSDSLLEKIRVLGENHRHAATLINIQTARITDYQILIFHAHIKYLWNYKMRYPVILSVIEMTMFSQTVIYILQGHVISLHVIR